MIIGYLLMFIWLFGFLGFCDIYVDLGVLLIVCFVLIRLVYY